MATTNIINHVLPQDPTQHPFSVPGQDLDSLLKTSLLLDFGSDVTPIQVLANIHRLAKNGWVIDNSTLKSFIQELSKYMRCNGYVIDSVISSSSAADLMTDMAQLSRNLRYKQFSEFSSLEKIIRTFLLGLHSNNLSNILSTASVRDFCCSIL
jgi:hypothetical protein